MQTTQVDNNSQQVQTENLTTYIDHEIQTVPRETKVQAIQTYNHKLRQQQQHPQQHPPQHSQQHYTRRRSFFFVHAFSP